MNFTYSIFLISSFWIGLTLTSIAQNVDNKSIVVEDNLSNKNSYINKFIDSLVKDFFFEKDLKELKLKRKQKNEHNPFIKPDSILRDRELNVPQFERAFGARLMVLDKIYGVPNKLEVFGQSEITHNTIHISLKECIYQKENRQGDSLALITIVDRSLDQPLFSGWISSTHSHLTNYDNYRYSLWLLSCIISDQE